jgi:hypothetical protein
LAYANLQEDCREIDAHKQRIGALRQKAEEMKRQSKEKATSEAPPDGEDAGAGQRGDETASCPYCGHKPNDPDPDSPVCEVQ